MKFSWVYCTLFSLIEIIYKKLTCEIYLYRNEIIDRFLKPKYTLPCFFLIGPSLAVSCNLPEKITSFSWGGNMTWHVKMRIKSTNVLSRWPIITGTYWNVRLSQRSPLDTRMLICFSHLNSWKLSKGLLHLYHSFSLWLLLLRISKEEIFEDLCLWWYNA